MQIKNETIVGLFILAAASVFFYMTFEIGVFRLDRGKYNPYTVYFEDVSGLAKKADVKIAGVTVGWVESIELLQDGKIQAKAHIMVSKKYELRQDAYAIVRQDGFLGGKYLEVVPGDPLLPGLGGGQALTKPGKSPVNIDEVLQRVKSIASNVDDITSSLRDAIGKDGTDNIKSMVSNFNEAASRMASFSTALERLTTNNEQNFNSIMSDLKDFTKDLRTGWPSVQGSVEKIANKFESTADAVEDTVTQARDTFRSVGEVADKLNEGRGLLGKLITDDETYGDVKVAIQGLKNYFAKVEKLNIVFDAHSESMWGVGEHFVDHLHDSVTKRDAKGYFGVRVYSAEDRFYLAQAVASRKGWIERYTTHTRAPDTMGLIKDSCAIGQTTVVTPTAISVYTHPTCEERTIQHRAGSLKFSLQLAKVFSDVAVRFGLFENSAGVGIDYDIPFRNDKFRWITSFEAFDFYGDDRIGDQRPHLKWLNRVFMFNNLYMTFGADDFISKHNANAFVGFGMRFADDDIKYITSKFSLPGSN